MYRTLKPSRSRDQYVPATSQSLNRKFRGSEDRLIISRVGAAAVFDSVDFEYECVVIEDARESVLPDA
ncbi:hypothetical protein GCM10009039_32270 [Halocalculus aciditolerans]|uniref:Uncharacterized protein n=1 Tax=Halocalculus aciditolerans TaxID=1383812 RepID=A0A830FMY6_9EURY|nr:hypothetical protein GCM10009039_32270 [Halocalculus aciditolerans]